MHRELRFSLEHLVAGTIRLVHIDLNLIVEEATSLFTLIILLSEAKGCSTM